MSGVQFPASPPEIFKKLLLLSFFSDSLATGTSDSNRLVHRSKALFLCYSALLRFIFARGFMDNPKYLLKNSYGIYHFRMVVPKRLRPALGQREVKRSLNTKSHGKALRLARRYATFLELLFEQQVVTKVDLAVIVDSFSTVKIAPPRKTKKIEYKLSPKKTKTAKSKSRTPAPQTANEQEFETYESVAERFVKHQRISKGWNAETEKGYVAILDIVQEIFGNIPINAIDHEMAEELRDVILQLPPNRTRSAEWKKLSIMFSI